MKRVALDANVVVSFVTDRDPAQMRRARELFEAAARAEIEIVLPQVCVLEAACVLLKIYELAPTTVAAALSSFLDLPGVSAVHEVNWSWVLDRWPEGIDSLGDAMIVSSALGARSSVLATFDRSLARRAAAAGLLPYWAR